MTANGDGIPRRTALKRGALATGTIVLGGAAVPGTAAAGIGEGRVGHYHLNNLRRNNDPVDSSRTVVHDASPERNHGEWRGGEDPIVDGPVGNAFEFDADVGEYIDISFGDGEVVTIENWTVAGWIQPSDWDGQERKEWLSVSEDRTDFRPLDFVHEDGDVKHYRGDAAGEVLSHDMSTATGWHHVAVTQNRLDQQSAEVELFVDGGDPVDSASGDYENMRPSLTFYIGTLARPSDRNFWWDGGIDEVRVYDRVLTDDEIEDLATMDED